MKLVDVIRPELVSTDLGGATKDEVMRSLAELLSGYLRRFDADTVLKALLERESLATTGVGEGVAIPHGKIAGIDQVIAAVGIHKKGVDFDSIDGRPVHLFVALLAPDHATSEHLQALALISRFLRKERSRQRLLCATDPREAYTALIQDDGQDP